MRCFGIVPLRNYESMKPNFAICVILILPLFAVFFVTSGHINLMEYCRPNKLMKPLLWHGLLTFKNQPVVVMQVKEQDPKKIARS